MHDKTSVQRATADDSRAERENGEECLLSLVVLRFFFFFFFFFCAHDPSATQPDIYHARFPAGVRDTLASSRATTSER